MIVITHAMAFKLEIFIFTSFSVFCVNVHDSFIEMHGGQIHLVMSEENQMACDKRAFCNLSG